MDNFISTFLKFDQMTPKSVTLGKGEKEMEGEKERQRQQREEKDSNEAEDDRSNGDADNEEEEEDEDSEGAALVWQEGYGEDNLGLPIMHWEGLSLHIAELEKQEEEKKAKSGVFLEQGRASVSWREERESTAEACEDGEDACTSHILALTSRESEEEEREGEINTKEQSNTWRECVQVQNNPQPAAKPEKPKSRGFRNTLRNLRDKLRTDNKTLTATHNNPVVQQKHLDKSDLQGFSIKDLNALCTSLRKAIQDLSSELVGRLQMRDQLRTEQDAMLLEVQDLTSM
ncbi:cilia- and flagella-associated protein 251 isoform X2 [Mastacembelus armatus]|uniref:cilia- and flagella-associated protein 251 isoform X2 n=1 Tax=Mastacembelus armatus TaxID=205130 RepID=UPI000E454EFE|nr:cilia- and flagella-associated protein 251-like isoform X2 [Mastacembelus armatus]